MSGSHEKLPMIFWVQIALVLIVGAIYLMTPAEPKHHGAEAAGHEVSVETKTALEPVGEVAIKEESSAAGGVRTGEAIVKKTCAACHAAGVANAPKLDATGKDAWTTRMTAEKGLDGLVASAKKGKNGMPPNGADPSLNDNELKLAIVYMLGQAGIEVAVEENAPARAADVTVDTKQDKVVEKPAVTTSSVPAKEETANKSETTPTPAAVVEEKSVATTEEVKEPLSPVAPNAEIAPAAPKAAAMPATEVPTAPKAAAMPAVEVPAAPAAPKVEKSQSAPVETTSAPEIAIPATEESKPASESVVEPTAPTAEKAQPATPVSAAPTVEKAQPATSVPAAPAEKAQPTTPVPAPAAEEAKSVAPTVNETAIDLVAGEKTYKSICFSCHDLAVANAPKPGDKAAWKARIAKGMDALYNTALKGDSKMPAMPAKGGNPTLSDSDVKNAVSYMVELSK